MPDGDDKRDRNPWEDRYGHDDQEDSETKGRSETSDASKTSKSKERSQMSKSSTTAESEESGGTVRERKNVNMYLPESLVDDLQLRYSELNVEWRRRHGEDMPKNEEFYPAAVRAALGESSIEEELGLNE